MPKGWTIKQYKAFIKKKPKYKVTGKRKHGDVGVVQLFRLKKDADLYAQLLRNKGRIVTVTKLPKI